MSVELYFLETNHTLVPSELIRAVNGFEGFNEVHLKYYVRYGGQDGLCTYQDAFEYLCSDLRDHNLPINYSTFQSFKTIKSRKHR